MVSHFGQVLPNEPMCNIIPTKCKSKMFTNCVAGQVLNRRPSWADQQEVYVKYRVGAVQR